MEVIEGEHAKGIKMGMEKGWRQEEFGKRDKGKGKMKDTNGHGVEDIPLIMRRVRKKRSERSVGRQRLVEWEDEGKRSRTW